jgi:hypothetical protein
MRWVAGLGNPAMVIAFGWMQAYVTGALTAIEAFLTARDAYLEDDSSKNRLAKDKARDAAKDAMKDFANTSIRYNKLMTAEQKWEYGIHTPRHGGPVSVPTTIPYLIIDRGTIRRIIIYYKDVNSKRRGKPRHVYGIEIRWAILDHVPESIEELVNVCIDTKPPLTLEFPEYDRGKRVYFCGSWRIAREGEAGPASAIEEAIIP